MAGGAGTAGSLPDVCRLAPVLLVVLFLAGCGAQESSSAEDFEGAQREVAVVLEDLEESARDSDEQRTCRLLARDLLARLQRSGTPCPRAVQAAFDDADIFDVVVDQVQVSGTTATARVATGTAETAPTDTIRLVREGANWRIVALAE